MSQIQFKKDPFVIVPYTLFTIGAFVLFGMRRLDWVQLLGLLAALNLASVFGVTKGDGGGDAPRGPTLTGLLLFVIPATMCLRFVACTTAPLTPDEKRVLAGKTFDGQLQECARPSQSRTRAEADVCAERVRREWDGGVK